MFLIADSGNFTFLNKNWFLKYEYFCKKNEINKHLIQYKKRKNVYLKSKKHVATKQHKILKLSAFKTIGN